MKKVFLSAVATVMVMVGAAAQDFARGDIFLGARSTGMGLNHTFGKGTVANTNFNLNLYGGYFFADMLAVDAMFGVDFTKLKGAATNTGFAFGAGVRYYPVDNLFARLSYRGDTATGVKLASTVSIEVGYDVFLSDDIFFEPAIYYARTLSGTKTNGLGLSLGFGVVF
jgi:opacity protein-like surface antigen